MLVWCTSIYLAIAAVKKIANFYKYYYLYTCNEVFKLHIGCFVQVNRAMQLHCMQMYCIPKHRLVISNKSFLPIKLIAFLDVDSVTDSIYVCRYQQTFLFLHQVDGS